MTHKWFAVSLCVTCVLDFARRFLYHRISLDSLQHENVRVAYLPLSALSSANQVAYDLLRCAKPNLELHPLDTLESRYKLTVDLIIQLSGLSEK